MPLPFSSLIRLSLSLLFHSSLYLWKLDNVRPFGLSLFRLLSDLEVFMSVKLGDQRSLEK